MSSHCGSDRYSSSSLVYKLCCHITEQPQDAVTSSYQFALQILNGSTSSSDKDEFALAEKMKKKLIRDGCQKEALIFSDLHRKLQTSTVLKNRCSVLALLFSLYNSGSNSFKTFHISNNLARIVTSSPAVTINAHDIINTKINNVYVKNMNSDEVFSNVSSKDYNTFLPHSKESSKTVGGTGEDGTDAVSLQGYNSRVALVTEMFSGKEKQQLVTWSSVKKEKGPVCNAKRKPSDVEIVATSEISQKQLLREVLYAVQAIDGNILCLEQTRNNCAVSIKSSLPNPIRRLVFRFTELGWMFHKVSTFCKIQSSEKTLGLVGQSFISSLEQELTEYYHLLAMLQSQLNQEQDSSDVCALSLHRLSVWFLEPYQRMKILASVVDACKGKKGGSLASALFSFLQHGDPSIQKLIKHLLKVVIQPLYRMLSYWIFCGELEDAYAEFFVAANLSVPDSSLWQEKYSLRKTMIPTFFSMEQARKILSTGKAINFLRQVCLDHSFLKEKNYEENFDATIVESLLSQEKDGEFQTILEINYRKTSSLVLSVLHTEYKLMDHLQAMRNYLLLGQGDFIRHLMDLLENDLAKPANVLYVHNLSGILESAIRATNAQFDNPDILQRLDVRLLEVSPGDTGWDVFSLDYHADGPIGTVFPPQCMTSYLRLFNTLWRAKRMEYVLSNMWQSQTTHGKLLKQIPEVTTISYHCHVLLSEMVHFVQQMQYYMAFEVMECCWADLLQKMSSAHDLDQVIAAHEHFLDTLLTRALLDEESKDLLTQLRAIYDLIIQFQNIQEKFWNQTVALVSVLEGRNKYIALNTDEGSWGLDQQKSNEIELQHSQFVKSTIPTAKAHLRVLARSYEDMVQKFLLMLNDHDDPNLRFLSFRLDFNEHYKSRNTRLHTSLTYQHRRRSIK